MLALFIYGSFMLSVTSHGGHHHSLDLPEISENKAKSFLTYKHIKSSNRNPAWCMSTLYEGWCEINKQYCQVHQEETREERCSTHACSPDQHCVLTTPCPAHFEHKCLDCRPGPADVMFLVDMSFSQRHVNNKTIKFISEFVKQIPIGPNDFQVAVVSFTSHPKMIFDFKTYQSNSSLLNALSLIKAENGPTKTADALMYASEEIRNPANGARLLSNISHYVILVTNGLSTDRSQAIHIARGLRDPNHHFKIYTVGIGEDIAHEELVQLPTDTSLSFSPDYNDLLLAMLKDAADYGCTDCNSTSVTDVIILFDTSEDSSPLKGGSLHSLKFVDKLVDSFDMVHTDIKVAMLTFSSDSQIKFNFSHTSNQDMKAKIVTTTVDNRQGNSSIRLGLLKMEEFFTSPLSGSRQEGRKICYLFTNGKWPTSENSELKHKIEELNAAGISVNVMVTVDDTDSYSDIDRSLTNAKDIAFDPYRVYMVEENNEHVIIQAAARETRYVKCPSDIFEQNIKN